MTSLSPISVAVVTGSHAFDVPQFHQLFRSIPGIDWYMQDLDNLAADAGHAFDGYDAFVFYSMHRVAPEGKVLAALERLGDRQQGIVIIHHALLAYQQWPRWAEISGVRVGENFSYHPGETVRIDVADADHPITRGLSSWDMVDETYVLPDAAAGSRVLLTTGHPQSIRTLGWTREFGKARVFCLASGHDGLAYGNDSFRTVLSRAIAWSAGRI